MPALRSGVGQGSEYALGNAKRRGLRAVCSAFERKWYMLSGIGQCTRVLRKKSTNAFETSGCAHLFQSVWTLRAVLRMFAQIGLCDRRMIAAPPRAPARRGSDSTQRTAADRPATLPQS
eukprot:7095930-Prymnesium_polylepis.2